MRILLFILISVNAFGADILRSFLPSSGSAQLNGSLSVSDDLTVDTNTLFVDSSSNRVGVGTDSPAFNFEVKGSTPVISLNSNSSSEGLQYRLSQNGAFVGSMGWDQGANVIYLNQFGNGSQGIAVDGSGNVGVNDSTPSYAIEAGSGAVAGNGAYVNTSDKRLKENSEALTGACSIVDQLTPLLYDWKSTVPSSYVTWANGFQFHDEDGNLQDGINQVDKQPHGQKDVGFFAQDVEPVFAQAVVKTDAGRYNLQYEKFIPLLVACIQEMRQ